MPSPIFILQDGSVVLDSCEVSTENVQSTRFPKPELEIQFTPLQPNKMAVKHPGCPTPVTIKIPKARKRKSGEVEEVSSHLGSQLCLLPSSVPKNSLQIRELHGPQKAVLICLFLTQFICSRSHDAGSYPTPISVHQCVPNQLHHLHWAGKYLIQKLD